MRLTAVCASLLALVLCSSCKHNTPDQTVVDDTTPVISTTPPDVTLPPNIPPAPAPVVATTADDDAIISAVIANGESEDSTESKTTTATRHDRAVVFGDNFPNSNAELHQCVNDAKKNVLNLVKIDHFNTKDIRLFTDHQCTKANYEKWTTWLLAGAKTGDRRFFGNSSHGAEDTGADGKIYDIVVTDEMVRQGVWDSTTEVSPEFWSNALRSTTVDFLFLNDCCHAGGTMKATMGLVATQKKRAVRSIDGPAPVQARLSAATQRGLGLRAVALTGTVIAACQPSELSEEDEVHGGLATEATWEARKNLPATAKSGDVIREANRILRSDFGASQHEGLIGVNKPVYSAE